MSLPRRLSLVIPSLGHSPWQSEMLAALRSELAGQEAELIWVHQGPAPAPEIAGPRERLLHLPRAVGFAAAANVGLTAADSRSDFVGLVNDDLVVEPGWLAAIASELERRPRAAAVQGANLELDRPARVEGCGLGWNRSWQAVQVAAGEPAPATSAPAFEVFGVSATAALFRRQALAAVSGAAQGARRAVSETLETREPSEPGFFDERLGSYYEDVELAVRLREAEWESWCIPAARARHAGQATAGRAPLRRWRAIHRNRLLVLRRLLGADFVTHVPQLAARDGRDLARALLRLDAARVFGVLLGWSAALPRLGAFAPRSEAAEAAAAAAAASRRALAAAERFRIGSAT